MENRSKQREQINNLDKELNEFKKEKDRQEAVYWNLLKYVKLLHILDEAKQLTKELESELNRIKPELSSLEKS